MDDRPIGVFDSGLGGLTALAELSRLLPDEHIIYLGDSHNMPYGEKTNEQITEMSRRNLEFLLSRDVKAVFIACGSATSNSLEALKRESPVPVFGIVEAASQEAAAATKNGKIGLLATRACVDSGAFQRRIGEISPELKVAARACPKLATMIEDGVFDKSEERVQRAVAEYLPALKDASVDTVILGCTHYPLLAEAIADYMGAGVLLISAGAAAAGSVRDYLIANGRTALNGKRRTEYYTTGNAAAFAKTAKLMLKRDISADLGHIPPLVSYRCIAT